METLNNNKSRFTFLKEDYPKLYELCADSEKYIDEDHSISLFKARQALEYIVDYLNSDYKNLFEEIGDLSDRGILPPYIISLFHFVRIKANNAIHMTPEDVSKSMEQTLNSLFEIALWLSVVNDKHNYSDAVFITNDDRNLFLRYAGKEDKAESIVDRDKLDRLPGIYKPFSANDFYQIPDDELVRTAFETKEEYKARIEALPAVHLGYAILDKEAVYSYLDVVFAAYHIDKNEKIILSYEDALYTYADEIAGPVADGEILAKLKVIDEKVYIDYSQIILENYDGKTISLKSANWQKYAYESDEERNARLKDTPVLPIAACVPKGAEYVLEREELPFKVSVLKYVNDILPIEEFVIKTERTKARFISEMREELICSAEIIHDEDKDNFYIKEIIINDKAKQYEYKMNFSYEYAQEILGRNVDNDDMEIDDLEEVKDSISDTIPADIVDDTIDSSDDIVDNGKDGKLVDKKLKDQLPESLTNKLKLLIPILIVLLVLGGYAFSVDGDTSGGSSDGNGGKEPSAKIGTIGGIKLFDTAIDEVESVYGTPNKKEWATEWSDCYIYGGQDQYAPFVVYYNRKLRTITGIIVRQGSYISQNIKTSKNIGIYDTVDDMKREYGEAKLIEAGNPGTKYVYTTDCELIEFWVLPDGRIVDIHSTIK